MVGWFGFSWVGILLVAFASNEFHHWRRRRISSMSAAKIGGVENCGGVEIFQSWRSVCEMFEIGKGWV